MKNKQKTPPNMTTEILNLTENGLAVLKARYLRRNEKGDLSETPAELIHRVAAAVAQAEKGYGADEARIEAVTQDFYRIMADGTFMPNSPTLMNAGREFGMLSACFVLPVEDTIDGIFSSIKNTALIQKAGGGPASVSVGFAPRMTALPPAAAPPLGPSRS